MQLNDDETKGSAHSESTLKNIGRLNIYFCINSALQHWGVSLKCKKICFHSKTKQENPYVPSQKYYMHFTRQVCLCDFYWPILNLTLWNIFARWVRAVMLPRTQKATQISISAISWWCSVLLPAARSTFWWVVQFTTFNTFGCRSSHFPEALSEAARWIYMNFWVLG